MGKRLAVRESLTRCALQNVSITCAGGFVQHQRGRNAHYSLDFAVQLLSHQNADRLTLWRERFGDYFISADDGQPQLVKPDGLRFRQSDRHYAVRQHRCGRDMVRASSGQVSEISAPLQRATVRAERLFLGGADLIDDSAVRVRKQQARDPVGCDL
jgi:hypothetical protein